MYCVYNMANDEQSQSELNFITDRPRQYDCTAYWLFNFKIAYFGSPWYFVNDKLFWISYNIKMTAILIINTIVSKNICMNIHIILYFFGILRFYHFIPLGYIRHGFIFIY